MSNGEGEGSRKALETRLTDTINCLYELSVMVYDFQEESGNQLVQNKINQLVNHYAEIDKLKDELDMTVPEEVVNLVQDGKIPDLFTQAFIERAAAENQYTNGKVAAVKDFRDRLASELLHNFPDMQDVLRSAMLSETASTRQHFHGCQGNNALSNGSDEKMSSQRHKTHQFPECPEVGFLLMQKLRRSCDNCYTNRVKCTGGQPCDRCHQSDLACIFSPRQQYTSKKRKLKNDFGSSTSPQDNLLYSVPLDIPDYHSLLTGMTPVWPLIEDTEQSCLEHHAPLSNLSALLLNESHPRSCKDMGLDLLREISDANSIGRDAALELHYKVNTVFSKILNCRQCHACQAGDGHNGLVGAAMMCMSFMPSSITFLQQALSPSDTELWPGMYYGSCPIDNPIVDEMRRLIARQAIKETRDLVDQWRQLAHRTHPTDDPVCLTQVAADKMDLRLNNLEKAIA
ncbi:hypothetical protein BZG36_04720 [Bifiguratus adelaidae]|uniref:Zn(2)-C6 fungal-type domain-containing protein n=1 Tax=Bifiguratus adelaidae TaxID=1938954 RepID=A0A261XV55_9FUNG|nr:hypothetical protein BZG36_04720 [Bifiguratus adelaidae]